MLKLNNNKLRSESLTQLGLLRKLVTLNLGNNQISRLPKDSLRALNKLKALVLNDNMIQTLDWLPKLSALGSLIISHNRISELDSRIILRLPNLIKLSLSHNQLTEIPDLSALPHLGELRLSHNNIQRVPSTLANNICLKLLDLGHNAVDDWSGVEALRSLEHLKQLNLRGNPIAGNSQTVESSDSKARVVDEKTTLYSKTMKQMFPHLVIRDGERVRGKKSHGYEAGMTKRKIKVKSGANFDDSKADVRDDKFEKLHAEGVSRFKHPPYEANTNPQSDGNEAKGQTDSGGVNPPKPDKKRKASSSEKQSRMDPASGVLQMRNCKRPAHRNRNLILPNEAHPPRLAPIDTVGLGGESAWD
ncbi:unnamed protein product [Albugo candida]|nr:unnamed protein product [Albugo candida]|eukprot:CCI40230.1 unnamed protein product [Albugo candida]